jgi:hypothetical protein
MLIEFPVISKLLCGEKRKDCTGRVVRKSNPFNKWLNRVAHFERPKQNNPISQNQENPVQICVISWFSLNPVPSKEHHYQSYNSD